MKQELITKKAAIDALELADFVKDKDYADGETLLFEKSAKERIKEIKPCCILFDAFPRWISVTHKLPETEHYEGTKWGDLYTSDPVLVYCEVKATKDEEITYEFGIAEYCYEPEAIWEDDYQEDIYYWSGCTVSELDINASNDFVKVLAWMKLPEPPKMEKKQMQKEEKGC